MGYLMLNEHLNNLNEIIKAKVNYRFLSITLKTIIQLCSESNINVCYLYYSKNIDILIE